MNKNNFSIKVREFDGPLDLLLELIQKKKLSINEISLADISENYISFVKNNEFKLWDATSFLSVAATLMLIKSRSLLPKIIFETEDEEDINILKEKLNILKEIKNISEKIKIQFNKTILYKKIFKKKIKIKFSPNENISTDNILLSINSLVSNIKIKEKLPEKNIIKQMTLQEISEKIYYKITKYIKLSFDEVMISNHKKDIAVSFLSILELFRNGKIDLKQNQAFGKIHIEKTEPDLIYKE